MLDRTIYELYEALHQRRVEEAKQYRLEVALSDNKRKSIPLYRALKQLMSILTSFNFGHRQEVPVSRGLYPYPPYKRC
jgi:hypothetical protein